MPTDATADKITILRRDCRDLEQLIKDRMEKAEGKLLTPEASARFNQEAEQFRRQLAEKESLIESLNSQRQLHLFT